LSRMLGRGIVGRTHLNVVSSLHSFADNIAGTVNNDAQGNQGAKTWQTGWLYKVDWTAVAINNRDVTGPYRRPIRFWGAAPPVCQTNKQITFRK